MHQSKKNYLNSDLCIHDFNIVVPDHSHWPGRSRILVWAEKPDPAEGTETSASEGTQNGAQQGNGWLEQTQFEEKHPGKARWQDYLAELIRLEKVKEAGFGRKDIRKDQENQWNCRKDWCDEEEDSNCRCRGDKCFSIPDPDSDKPYESTTSNRQCTYMVEKARTYFGQCGRRLRGLLALEHALRVHQDLHRQVLRLPNLSGFDVGFPVREQLRSFGNSLALRAHVANKTSPRLLREGGIPDISDIRYILRTIYCRHPQEECEVPTFERLRPFLEEPKCENPGLESAAEDFDFAEFKKRLHEVNEGASGEAYIHPIPGLTPCDLSVVEDGFACETFAFWKEKPDDEGESRGSAAANCRERQSVFCCCDEDDSEESEDHECRGHSILRLAICGVPLDVLGAHYQVLTNPPGRQGVFTAPRRTARYLPDADTLRTGSDRVEPLAGGISIGTTTGQAGTLGLIVWDDETGDPCILSNWHVLGGNTRSRFGQPVYQPALFDGGVKGDAVAHLDRWLLTRDGDAALARLNGTRKYVTGEILGLWHPIADLRTPRLNSRVRKWGRATGFTEAFVDGIQFTGDIDYGGGLVRRFENQVHLAPLQLGGTVSEPGDSGAVVVSRRIHRACGCGRCCKDDDNPCDKSTDRDSSVEKVFAELRKIDGFEELEARSRDKKNRSKRRIYFAVGMIFAGDTPGSPLGEFAIASNMETLSEQLRFSVRPVFASRDSFREIRSVGPQSSSNGSSPSGGGRTLAPSGLGTSDRAAGPTPDPLDQEGGGGG